MIRVVAAKGADDTGDVGFGAVQAAAVGEADDALDGFRRGAVARCPVGFGFCGGFRVGVFGCAGWEGLGERAGELKGGGEFGGGDAVIEVFFVGGEGWGRGGAFWGLGDGFEGQRCEFRVLRRVLRGFCIKGFDE